MVTRASELSRVMRRAVSPASTASLKVARRSRSVGRVGQRRLLAFEGVRVERCACALERGFDRLRRRLEDRGGFVGVEAEHVAQHERCALLRRQLLQRDDERELDRFALLVACFRSGSGIRKCAVRVRLEPARLDGAAGF